MYTWTRRMRVIYATLLISICVSGCGRAPQKQVLGTWQAMDSKGTSIEFLTDGTLSMTVNKGGFLGPSSTGGTWRILPDGKLELIISLMGFQKFVVSEMEFQGAEMILTDEDGPKHYKRVK